MKKAFFALGCIILAAAGIRFGPAAISYAFIPPERGYFRYYRNFDTESGKKWEEYWVYWRGTGRLIEAASPRTKYTDERWELVPDAGRRYFLYDIHNEFDGWITFTRTEMILRGQDGREERYPRVLNLWEIWLDGQQVSRNDERYGGRLAAGRARYQQLIETRMKERGIRVPASAAAQRRPPVARPAPAGDSAGMVPLFAMTEYGYGNSTGTVFAVYANGTVICRSLPENPDAPYHRCDVADAGQFLRELLGSAYTRQKEKIRLSDGTDQTESTLWTPGKVVQIYGNWRKPDGPWRPQEEWDDSDRRLSEEMKQRWKTELVEIGPTLRKIEELRKMPGPNWLPEKIEVSFREYEQARDRPIEWPSVWPGLYDESSRKHDAYSYSVYVPAKDFPKLKTFLDSRTFQGAVMIDLKQMAPDIRFPFPSEKVWQGRLQASE